MREHEHEPVAGLPEALPPGETVLWQGAPRWTGLARRSFRLGALALYFAAIAAWNMATLAQGGASAGALAAGLAWPLALGAAAAGLVLAFAVLSARTTLYTITSRRVVLRALPDAEAAGRILARALAAHAAMPVAPRPADAPVAPRPGAEPAVAAA